MQKSDAERHLHGILARVHPKFCVKSIGCRNRAKFICWDRLPRADGAGVAIFAILLATTQKLLNSSSRHIAFWKQKRYNEFKFRDLE